MTKRRTRLGPNGTATLVIGIVLTVVGAGTLLDRFTEWDPWAHLWRLWPVLLVIMGAYVLINHFRRRGSKAGGREGA
jgi:uncharacterized membrane protein HdeD (DUF308 family)